MMQPHLHERPFSPAPRDRRSIGELVRELVDDAKGVLRDEIQLAKTETKENAVDIAKRLVPFGYGAAAGIAAFLLAIVFVDAGLTMLLAQAFSIAIAVWLAPLLLTIAMGVTALVLVKKAKDSIQRQHFGLDKTRATLQENKQWIKQHVT